MNTLAIILARKGSRGLPRKNWLDVGGQPMFLHSVLNASRSKSVDRIVVSSDDKDILNYISRVDMMYGAQPFRRSPATCTDEASVYKAARETILVIAESYQEEYKYVVILYGNVPIRPPYLIDRAMEKLCITGCDSVQSVCPVGKNHPNWMKVVHDERLLPYVGDMFDRFDNDRRQDLPQCYRLDGGVIACRADLLAADHNHPHGFLGEDQRGIITKPGDVIDVDDEFDLLVARAVWRDSNEHKH